MFRELLADNLCGSPQNQQAMDKKKTPFKQTPPFERTKNTPKKEGFVFSFVKPLEAAAVPLPPEPEEAAVVPEDVFDRRPKCEQKDLEIFGEEDKVRQGEGTDLPRSYSVVSFCAPKLIPLSL